MTDKNDEEEQQKQKASRNFANFMKKHSSPPPPQKKEKEGGGVEWRFGCRGRGLVLMETKDDVNNNTYSLLKLRYHQHNTVYHLFLQFSKYTVLVIKSFGIWCVTVRHTVSVPLIRYHKPRRRKSVNCEVNAETSQALLIRLSSAALAAAVAVLK